MIPLENFSFAPELPHFMSLKEMTLLRNRCFKDFHKYLHHYVNLEVFSAHWVAEIEDATVSEIVNAGGFRKLSKIFIAFCGHLTLQTAMLLIDNCDNLSVMGYLSNWCGVNDDDEKELLDFVKTNNLELSVTFG
jgi:hypothetical protein